ncbi:uncharacterized protein LOC128966501 [Oppia nitens]|uniref:uncharacterized protein LOC128966501 n=1 Tax=Oppia nitens TaxID=1686743 RepID=UPI0023DB5AB2|nr:uncharacterized protein LOC128966501 [Oppia nitens]
MFSYLFKSSKDKSKKDKNNALFFEYIDHSITENEISELDALKSARKQSLSPQIIQNHMNDSIMQTVLSIVRQGISDEDNCFKLCKHIVDKLNEELGHRWQCRIDYRKGSNSYFAYEPQFLIQFTMGFVYFEIYKIQFFDCQQFINAFKCGKISSELNIIETDMNDHMITDVKEITFNAIEKSNNLYDISYEIRTQMDKRYDNHKWQCIDCAYFGSFSISKRDGSYITYKVADLQITLFQTMF